LSLTDIGIRQEPRDEDESLISQVFKGASESLSTVVLVMPGDYRGDLSKTFEGDIHEALEELAADEYKHIRQLHFIIQFGGAYPFPDIDVGSPTIISEREAFEKLIDKNKSDGMTVTYSTLTHVGLEDKFHENLENFPPNIPSEWRYRNLSCLE
jgi:hypothetical protein